MSYGPDPQNLVYDDDYGFVDTNTGNTFYDSGGTQPISEGSKD